MPRGAEGISLSIRREELKKHISSSQNARVLTESWTHQNIYCPNCGQEKIDQYRANKPVADFYCRNCQEDYELKSKQGATTGAKIVDGAYGTMIERLQSTTNPNFFFLNYDLSKLEVINFCVIPKYFFTPEIIEKRNPLAQTARRAGWIGCNILLKEIPETGKIFYVRNGAVEPKEKVLSNWQKTTFLRQEKDFSVKGWLLDIMKTIDKVGQKNFSLDNLYKFESQLQILHPENDHIKDKIRQQLQILRDRGYLEFVGHGRYQLI